MFYYVNAIYEWWYGEETTINKGAARFAPKKFTPQMIVVNQTDLEKAISGLKKIETKKEVSETGCKHMKSGLVEELHSVFKKKEEDEAKR
jgi:predicted RNA-binding protein